MKLHHLEKASDYEVADWLKTELKLTPYQIDSLSANESIRFSPYSFYKRPKKIAASIWWRLTILVWPIYYLVLFLGLPLNMILTSSWGYGDKFYDNFHAKWQRKIGL